MDELNWYRMAVLACLPLAVLGGLWWMLRVNAKDRQRLERELMMPRHWWFAWDDFGIKRLRR